jgi:hypothetical protein
MRYQLVSLKKIIKRLTLTWEVFSTGNLGKRDWRQVPPITPQEVAEIKTFFPLNKFFITGHPRSGTTLITRLVRLHPDVHCNYQSHFFTREPSLISMLEEERYEQWLSSHANRWNRGRDLSPVALRAMADYIMERDARRVGKTIVGDKSPNLNTKGKAIERMHLIYPDTCVIYMVRDGRDALLSHLFQFYIGKPHQLPKRELRIRNAFAKNPEPFFAGERSVFTEERIRKSTRLWVENVTESDQAGRDLYGDRYLALRFEDLLGNPFETVSQVWRLLGKGPMGMEDLVVKEMEQNPDADWQNEVGSDVVSKLKKGKKGSWRKLFTERDKRIFKQIAGELLIDWGYEQDLDW